jgi:hypothetical protein
VIIVKRFNTRGVCVPEKHYMVDVSSKLVKIMELINQELYFAINRPRQYGKTTTLFLLEKKLLATTEYLPLSISFEGIGQESYASVKLFIAAFTHQIARALTYLKADQLYDYLKNQIPDLADWDGLSQLITGLTNECGQKMVLIIDEVDKSSNNQLFLDFLGLLRNKYLLQSTGKDTTFHSVILAGVHDVKTLKLKLRPDDERKYNSPWNIAADFNVDLSFSAAEIATMLTDYQNERQIKLDVVNLAEQIWFYTSGYPFLVSRICEVIDTRLTADWKDGCVEQAVKLMLAESNPNFDDMIKNLEHNPELAQYVRTILLDGAIYIYNPDNPLIELGTVYGILADRDGQVRVHNHLYAQRIYNYLSSKLEMELANQPFHGQFIEDGRLNMERVLLKFQQFMREQHSVKDGKFLEREGRLVLLAFIKPIINGQGFDFKEAQISEEKRLDIVITFANRKYVLELKRWAGEAAHRRGLKQLADYLERQGLDRGYLVVFDFRKDSEVAWQDQRTTVDGKEIVMVRVGG